MALITLERTSSAAVSPGHRRRDEPVPDEIRVKPQSCELVKRVYGEGLSSQLTGLRRVEKDYGAAQVENEGSAKAASHYFQV